MIYIFDFSNKFDKNNNKPLIIQHNNHITL